MPHAGHDHLTGWNKCFRVGVVQLRHSDSNRPPGPRPPGPHHTARDQHFAIRQQSGAVSPAGLIQTTGKSEASSRGVIKLRTPFSYNQDLSVEKQGNLGPFAPQPCLPCEKSPLGRVK